MLFDPRGLDYFRLSLDGGSYMGIFENGKGRFYPVIRLRRSKAGELDLLNSWYHGYRYVSKTKSGAPIHWLNYQDKRAYDLLEEMVDLLNEKKPQAELILEFRASVAAYRKAKGVSAALTAEERAKRRDFIERLQTLNNAVPVVPLDMEGENFTITDPDKEIAEEMEELDRLDGTAPEPPADEEFNIFDLK